MQKTALVTGGFGFLGRAIARRLKQQGFRVVGIGHGEWSAPQASAHGFDAWLTSDVSLAGLVTLKERYQLVVHCAANGSVQRSLSDPLQAFNLTVQSTAELLEHLRHTSPEALVIYPSSAAVYGAASDKPLLESDQANPVSPYGYQKKITEDLLECYARCFGIKVAVIRFFSIYGPGLAKQLLWDAAGKLSAGGTTATFWGTGDETRDWLHVDDAAALVARLAESEAPFTVINGASGDRVTVRAVIEMLKSALGADISISFNGAVKPGDPRFYHADVSKARQLGLQPTVALADGLHHYAQWFRKHGQSSLLV